MLLWAGFPWAVRVTAAAIPVAWERALGDWVLDDVLEFLALFDDGEARVCEEGAGRAALVALTGELAAASGSPYEFRVLVVDFDMANAFALPIADKLAHRSQEERINKTLILETIGSIQEGLNPRVMEELLKTYLPASKRGDEGEQANAA